jgi:hypothetical protein
VPTSNGADASNPLRQLRRRHSKFAADELMLCPHLELVSGYKRDLLGLRELL